MFIPGAVSGGIQESDERGEGGWTGEKKASVKSGGRGAGVWVPDELHKANQNQSDQAFRPINESR